MTSLALRRRIQRDKNTVPVSADADPEKVTKAPNFPEDVETNDDANADDAKANSGDAEAVPADSEASPGDVTVNADDSGKRPGRIHWRRLIAYGVMPSLALILAVAAGYLKWQDSELRAARLAGAESVRAATDSTIAMLSYKPDTVENDLAAARNRLSGNFKDAYTSLVHDVVIPGSQQKKIAAVATVPAAASVSASPNHAVVLVFVNQTITVGSDPPTSTASRVRVTLEKAGGRWLISGFDPI